MRPRSWKPPKPITGQFNLTNSQLLSSIKGAAELAQRLYEEGIRDLHNDDPELLQLKKRAITFSNLVHDADRVGKPEIRQGTRDKNDLKRRYGLKVSMAFLTRLSRHTGSGGLVSRVHDRVLHEPLNYVVGRGMSAIVSTFLKAVVTGLFGLPIQVFADKMFPILDRIANQTGNPVLKEALIATYKFKHVYLDYSIQAEYFLILSSAVHEGFPKVTLRIATDVDSAIQIWNDQVLHQKAQEALKIKFNKNSIATAEAINKNKKPGEKLVFPKHFIPTKLIGVVSAGHSLFTGIFADHRAEDMSRRDLAINEENARLRREKAREGLNIVHGILFAGGAMEFEDQIGAVLLAPPLPEAPPPLLQVGEYTPRVSNRSLFRNDFPPVRSRSRPNPNPTSSHSTLSANTRKRRSSKAQLDVQISPQVDSEPEPEIVHTIPGRRGRRKTAESFIPVSSSIPVSHSRSSAPSPPPLRKPVFSPAELAASEKKKALAKLRSISAKRIKLAFKRFTARKELLRINKRFSPEIQAKIRSTIETAVEVDSSEAVKTSWILLTMIYKVIENKDLEKPSLSSLGKNSNLHNIIFQASRIARSGSQTHKKDGTHVFHSALRGAVDVIMSTTSSFIRNQRLTADAQRLYDSSILMTTHIKLHLGGHKKFGIPNYVNKYITLTLRRVIASRLLPILRSVFHKTASAEDMRAFFYLSSSENLQVLAAAVYRSFSIKPKEDTTATSAAMAVAVDDEKESKDVDMKTDDEIDQDDPSVVKKKKEKSADLFCASNVECQNIIKSLSFVFWPHVRVTAAFQMWKLREQKRVDYRDLAGEDDEDNMEEQKDEEDKDDADYNPEDDEDTQGDKDTDAVLNGSINDLVSPPTTDFEYSLQEEEDNNWAALILLRFIITQQKIYIDDAIKSGITFQEDTVSTADIVPSKDELDPAGDESSDDRGGDEFVDPLHTRGLAAVLSGSTSDSDEDTEMGSTSLDFSEEDSKKFDKVYAKVFDHSHAYRRNTTLLPISNTRMSSITLRKGVESMFPPDVQTAIVDEIVRMQNVQSDEETKIQDAAIKKGKDMPVKKNHKVTPMEALFLVNGARGNETRVPTSRTDGFSFIPFYKKPRSPVIVDSLKKDAEQLAQPSISKPINKVIISAASLMTTATQTLARLRHELLTIQEDQAKTQQ